MHVSLSFSLAQGWCNDIKPSFGITDGQATGTGQAVHAGCNNGAGGTNGNCGNVIIATKEVTRSETCMTNDTIIDNDDTDYQSPN